MRSVCMTTRKNKRSATPSARACQPVTLCKNWTYRHGQKKCYLLKSCCVKEATGFQSGDESCPEAVMQISGDGCHPVG